MSSAGRVVSSNDCVTKPKGRETGLHSCFVQIRSSSLTGSYVMEMAEQREPYESRGSRTVLGEPGGESPPGHSTIEGKSTAICKNRSSASSWFEQAESGHLTVIRVPVSTGEGSSVCVIFGSRRIRSIENTMRCRTPSCGVFRPYPRRQSH